MECSDEYQYSGRVGAMWFGPFPYLEGDLIPTGGFDEVIIEGRRANCHPNSGCNDTGWGQLAQWDVGNDSEAPVIT